MATTKTKSTPAPSPSLAPSERELKQPTPSGSGGSKASTAVKSLELSQRLLEASSILVDTPWLYAAPPSGLGLPPPAANSEVPRSANVAAVVDFLRKEVLAEIGVYEDEASLALLDSGSVLSADIEGSLVGHGVPLARARMVAGILLKAAKPAAKVEVAPTFRLAPEDRPVAQWGDRQLVDALSLDHPQRDEVAEVLDRKAHGRPFVVYVDEDTGEVHIEATLRLLKAAKVQQTPVHARIGDSLRKTYRAVERPCGVFVECPLHPGVLLVDGYCDQCAQSWTGVAYETMQFARLAQEADEAPEKPRDIVGFIADLKEGQKGFAEHGYPKAALAWAERSKDGTLPVLRRRQSSVRVSDPLAPGQRY